MGTPALLRLVVQDAKQPSAHGGPPFEPIERFEKGQEYLLRQILGIGWRESKAARGPIDPPSLLVNDFANGCGIAIAQALEQQSSSKRHVPIIGVPLRRLPEVGRRDLADR